MVDLFGFMMDLFGFMMDLGWIYDGFMMDLWWIYDGFMMDLWWIYGDPAMFVDQRPHMNFRWRKAPQESRSEKPRKRRREVEPVRSDWWG